MTEWIQNRANELLRNGNAGVKRMGYNSALRAATTTEEDFLLPYVHDLAGVVDMKAVRDARRCSEFLRIQLRLTS